MLSLTMWLFYMHLKIKRNCLNIKFDVLLLRDWHTENEMVVKVDKTKHIDFDSEGFYFTNEFKFHDV